MDSKTNVPSFTVSLRGYDRMEVDEYLDSLADALSSVDDASDQNRRLQAHIGRLNERIKELEERVNAEAPKTGVVLGERIGIMLRTAEETATETIEAAEGRAGKLVAEAEQRVAEAEETARVAIAGGQEQARRIEAAARAEAAEIISEAEARATARTRQIEQWAEQVVSHTRAEEARMLREQQEKRDAAVAELRSLGEQRDSVAATLAELRETLGRALGLVVPPASAAAAEAVRDEPVGAEPEEEIAAETSDVASMESPEVAPAEEESLSEPIALGSGEPENDWVPVHSDDHPAGSLWNGSDTDEATSPGPVVFDAESLDADADAEDEGPAEPDFEEPVTTEVQVVDAFGVSGPASAEDFEFEAKLEAWVSDGAKHFRRQ